MCVLSRRAHGYEFSYPYPSVLKNKCDAENLCQNGGYPSPRLCTECFCPENYGGNHCEELQGDVECNNKMDGIRELDADWQTRTLDTEIFCWSKPRCLCIWIITPKDGKKLRIQLKRLEIEARGARLCCPDAIAQMALSQNLIEAEEPGTDIFISARLGYSRSPVKFELTYETGQRSPDK
uniref:EGF-like domain-containing protein n=1 Tax=Globodera rostochiensis TaxID=31243 RepID=A0A914H991_GLORO